MKKNNLLYLLIVLLMIGVTFGFTKLNEPKPIDKTTPKTIDTTNAGESFDIMMSVITHKRCVNCHPSDDRPRQGEDSHVHYYGVQRGTDGHGTAALKCESCHRNENNDNANVPGAPHWHLAPKSMAWQGLSRVEIAKAMMNPAKNGGKSLAETVKHLTEDDLVLWAFEPGVNQQGIPREKPPVSEADFIAAVKAWAAAGAPIPEK